MNKYILTYSIEIDADNKTIAEMRGKELIVDNFNNLLLSDIVDADEIEDLKDVEVENDEPLINIDDIEYIKASLANISKDLTHIKDSFGVTEFSEEKLHE